MDLTELWPEERSPLGEAFDAATQEGEHRVVVQFFDSAGYELVGGKRTGRHMDNTPRDPKVRTIDVRFVLSDGEGCERP